VSDFFGKIAASLTFFSVTIGFSLLAPELFTTRACREGGDKTYV